jgi:uncharacterized membrane protein
MSVLKALEAYFLTFLVFLGIDLIWLMFIAKDFYKKQIGHLMAEKALLGPAFIFYLLFVVGILVFVVWPNFEKSSMVRIFLMGFLFGAIAYATYDLTNLATLKNWPVIVSVIDIIWGGVLSGTVSVAGSLIVGKIR